jgi:hypothetical protein
MTRRLRREFVVKKSGELADRANADQGEGRERWGLFVPVRLFAGSLMTILLPGGTSNEREARNVPNGM